jgi:ATP-dependent 26S proteasome regulatory subunit
MSLNGRVDFDRDRLRPLLDSGCSLLQLVSYEWERVDGALITAAIRMERKLYKWTGARRLQTWNIEKSCFDVVDEMMPVELLEWYRDLKEEAILLLEDSHMILEENNTERGFVIWWLREIARMTKSENKCLILGTVMPTTPLELDKEMPIIELDLPRRDTIGIIFDDVVEEAGLQGHQIEKNESLLDAALGLTIMEARLAFSKAAATKGRLTSAEIDFVIQEKERIIRQSGVLEYFHPRTDWDDIGGLDELKHWLKNRGRAFTSQAKAFGLEPPRGALLLGVPGCGKSLTAKAVAGLWRFPLLRFDLGRVFGGIVGESEANMRKALQIAQAISPCILWIDEIEKGMAGSQGSGSLDSGVTARVMGTFLTWMQEKEEPVFVLATSNNIDQLPPEMLRKGRFDEIFFVDLPGSVTRGEILQIHLKKKGRHEEAESFDLASLVKASIGFSGAELEEAVKDALFRAFDAGREIEAQDIQQALEATYPLSKTMRENIEGMRKWAKYRARLASSEEKEVLPTDGEDVPRLPNERRNLFIRGDAA